MNENDIVERAINDITYYTRKFPEEAFEILSDHSEEVIPYLIESLDNIIDWAKKETEDNEYQLHLYALYFLAEFHDTSAFPKIIEFISLPDLDYYIGDVITEGLKDILYCTYNGDIELLQDYISNTKGDEYAKSAALDVYEQLYMDGNLKREELVEFLKKLIYFPSIENEWLLDTTVAGIISQQHLIEMLPDLQYLFQEERIDINVRGSYDSYIDHMFKYLDEGSYHPYGCKQIQSAADSLRHWAMFDQPSTPKKQGGKKKRGKGVEDPFEQMMKEVTKNTVYENKTEKVYPNDPCPCGSGKKYKKCCKDKPQSLDNDMDERYKLAVKPSQKTKQNG